MGFEIIGHRGAAGHAPENTAPSFDLAARLGVDAIELDVRLTNDGIPIVIHDATVDRVTDGTGQVCDLTAKELKRLDAGSWFDDAFRGTRLLFLDEVLADWASKIPLVIEIKELVRHDELIERLSRSMNELDSARVTISSFSLDVLTAARRHTPNARLAWLFRQSQHALDEVLEKAGKLELAQLCPNATEIDQRWVKRVKDAGYSVRTWGIPTGQGHEMVRAMRRIIAAGVDGSTADFPDVMRTTLMACR